MPYSEADWFEKEADYCEKIANLEAQVAALKSLQVDDDRKQAAAKRLDEMARRSGRAAWWNQFATEKEREIAIELERILGEMVPIVPSSSRLCDEDGANTFHLFLVSILNRYRLELLHKTGHVSACAMRRGIGVGSQTQLDGHGGDRGVCLSEEITGNPPTLKTTEVFRQGDAKTTIC